MKRIELINSLYITDLRIILSEKKGYKAVIRIIFRIKLLN